MTHLAVFFVTLLFTFVTPPVFSNSAGEKMTLKTKSEVETSSVLSTQTQVSTTKPKTVGSSLPNIVPTPLPSEPSPTPKEKQPTPSPSTTPDPEPTIALDPYPIPVDPPYPLPPKPWPTCPPPMMEYQKSEAGGRKMLIYCPQIHPYI